MFLKNVSFNYDESEDVLLLFHPTVKSKGSIEFGKSIHISFSPKFEVIGIEFLNASKVLAELSGTSISKNFLKNLSKCKIGSESSKGLNIITFFLENTETATKAIEEKLIIQDLKHKSPITEIA